MSSLKDKVAILKSLESEPFDSSKIDEFLKHAIVPDMASPILKRILKYLIDVDSQISASFELIDDEEWELLVSNQATVIDEHFDLKTKIDCFTMHFFSFLNTLENNEISLILEILSFIFEVRTKNVQFILFLIAKKYPKQVFGFLLSKMKKLPTIYTPFFCSLLVRLKFDKELKIKCFQAFQRHLTSQKPSKCIQYIVLLQSFMYVLCFRDFEAGEETIKCIKTANSLILFPLLNKDIVNKFLTLPVIGKLNFKEPVFHSLSNNCLYFFPFDLPIIPAIKEMVESDFINFEDS